MRLQHSRYGSVCKGTREKINKKSLLICICLHLLLPFISYGEKVSNQSIPTYQATLNGTLWVTVSNLDKGYEFQYLLPNAIKEKIYQVEPLEVIKEDNSNWFVQSRKFKEVKEQYWYPITRREDYQKTLGFDIENLRRSHIVKFDGEYIHSPQLSPDSRFVAYVKDVYLKETKEKLTRLVIRQLPSKQIIADYKSQEKIQSFRWSPNSQGIGIVSAASSISLWPWDLSIAIFTGHTAAYSTFYLSIIDLNGQQIFY